MADPRLLCGWGLCTPSFTNMSVPVAVRSELRLCRRFPPHLHPLQVLTPRAAFSSGRWPSAGSRCVLSLRSGTSWSPGPGLFVSATVSEEEPPETGPQGEAEGGTGPQGQAQGGTGPQGQVTGIPLRIYTSKLFPKHYGLWMEEDVAEESPGLQGNEFGAQAWLRVSLVHSVPILTKVVLGARSKASLYWAGSQNFANGLLVLICQQQQILLRQGDVPVIPYHPIFGEDSGEVFTNLLELVVLECQPVLQGVLSVNTSLVLTEFREASQLPCSELQPVRHLQPLCVSDFAHYTSGVWGAGFGMEHGKPLDSDIMTFLRALECRLEVTVVDVPALLNNRRLRPHTVAGQNSSLDADNLLVLTKPALQRLGLFNREWVLISLLEPTMEREQRAVRAEPEAEQPDQTGEPYSSPSLMGGSSDRWLRGRLASVVVVEVTNSAHLELAENTAAISHTLWFNISNGAPMPIASRTLKIKRFYQPAAGSKQLKDSRSTLSIPPLANELHVKVIFSPTYNARAVYDGLLFEHFKTPRLIHSGDVLCVRTQGKAEFIESSSERSVRWPVLYLKVSSVSGHAAPESGPDFLADNEHTSLYLDGCVNSFIPAAAASNGHQFWGSTSPPGLTDIVDILSSIMQPYLHTGPPILDWPCSVLLWGPSGCGKTTVLQAACSKFNLHLVKVDCVCLSADSTAASEAKLQAAFAEAEVYCPSVLLLHNMAMIGRMRDNVGADSRLISSFHRLMKSLPLSCREYPVVVVGTVGRLQDLFTDVQTLFLHEVGMANLSEDQRKLILTALSTELPLGNDVNLAKLAKLTAGYQLSDLCALLSHASHAACSRLRNSCFPGAVLSMERELDLCMAGVTILWEDFQSALDQLQTELSQAIGAPKGVDTETSELVLLPDDFKKALATLQPSVSQHELSNYKQIQQKLTAT
ncbi:peroxisome assembly factor 2-like [Chiloscyllium plagiosum]|uniref:peroxisome assembly factor 2-like n=1 Tax=Chiloscyllium plagiosum TaxID=36176 RepID=UPI001CB863A5|nr:peroxisome assembly factor 2-like [Chiloscyllium plagiosum]